MWSVVSEVAEDEIMSLLSRLVDPQELQNTRRNVSYVFETRAGKVERITVLWTDVGSLTPLTKLVYPRSSTEERLPTK